MATRWKRYFKKEMRKPEVRKLVEKSLELNEHHVRLIKKGLRAAEQGKLVSHAEMKDLIAKMRGKKKVSKRSGRDKVRKGLKILSLVGAQHCCARFALGVPRLDAALLL